MNTLIVYYHPYEGSYCNAILRAVQDGLRNGDHACKIVDLEKDGFDPVMHAKDLKAFALMGHKPNLMETDLDPLVYYYKQMLEWAERMVFIFPVWWMTMPAMMKGFIDKVIFPGIAYNMENGRLVSRLHMLKEVVVISTMNTPAETYRDQFNNSLEGSLIKGTFHQIGINEVEWISINMVKQSGQTKRELWLKDITKRFMRPD